MQNACIMTTKKRKLFQHYWLKHFNKQLSCMERKKWNYINWWVKGEWNSFLIKPLAQMLFNFNLLLL